MYELLKLNLLGGFRITTADVPLSFAYAKAHALLCYLAVTGRPHSRDALATLFWSDMPDRRAKKNLRDVLSNLQHHLAPHLNVTRETIAFNSSRPYSLDVEQFVVHTASLGSDARLTEQTFEPVRLAVELYRGEFLEGFYVHDAPLFEEWVLLERERLQQLAMQAWFALAVFHTNRGEYAQGLDYCRRMLAVEPWREQAHRQLMFLLALDGQRDAALAQYQKCCLLLTDEFGLEPSKETNALYERIAAGALDRLVEPSPARSIPMPHTPLVGRAPEYAWLEQAWQKAAAGNPQCVVISGEAGIGKTRLAEEWVAWAAAHGVATASAQGHENQSDLIYVPVVQWLRADALRMTLPLLDDVWLAELARLLPEIRTKRPNLPPPAPMTDAVQRTRLFEALARATLLSKKALALWLDSLQWCDRETLEWLQYLLRFDAQARLLILTTMRVEETIENPFIADMLFALRRGKQLTEIELGPLDQAASTTLANHLAGHELSATQAARLYRETEGNALFLVETIQAGILEQTEADIPTLPPTIQAVIARRLAQLSPPAHECAGAAAAIGRDFDATLLAQAYGGGTEALLIGLEELTRRRILHERGAAIYDFSHAKIREVAYGELSAARRQALHGRIGKALEALEVNNLDAISGQIAGHYERAGMVEQAIAFYQRAGEAAHRVYANTEAIGFLRKALEMLSRLPASSQRAKQEFAMQMTLWMALRISRGYASPEAERSAARARELAQGGQIADLFPALVGAQIAYLHSGKLQMSAELGEQMLEMAQTAGNSLLMLAAHYGLASTFSYLGDFEAVRQHADQCIALYDPEWHSKLMSRYGNDFGVDVRVFAALAQWYLGYPDRAVQTSQEALALAERLSDYLLIASALCFATWTRVLRRDAQVVLDQAGRLVSLASEKGIHTFSVVGMGLRGWALAALGQPKEGITLLRQALDAYQQAGAKLARTIVLGLMAEAFIWNGQPKAALEQIDDALQFARQTEERFYEAELHRLRGEALLQMVHGEAQRAEYMCQAEACFRQALQVAREQGAPSLELRATMSLARLALRRAQNRSEARAMLAEIYNRFTEGFDTADLKEARVLLDELYQQRT
jgi:predicted ATPase/DNA-binding SARP family transcriptional activator